MNTLLFLGGAGLVGYTLYEKNKHKALACVDAQGAAIACPVTDEQKKREQMMLLGGGALILGALIL